MLAPLFLAMAQGLGVPAAPPVLAVGFGASMAFMLPVSTPPNAIVYGTGQVPIGSMILVGVLLDLLAFVLVLAVLRLLCPVLGLA
jgi:sodium-dependent dicarboxylate transporter 2/3/5